MSGVTEKFTEFVLGSGRSLTNHQHTQMESLLNDIKELAIPDHFKRALKLKHFNIGTTKIDGVIRWQYLSVGDDDHTFGINIIGFLAQVKTFVVADGYDAIARAVWLEMPIEKQTTSAKEALRRYACHGIDFIRSNAEYALKHSTKNFYGFLVRCLDSDYGKEIREIKNRQKEVIDKNEERKNNDLEQAENNRRQFEALDELMPDEFQSLYNAAEKWLKNSIGVKGCSEPYLKDIFLSDFSIRMIMLYLKTKGWVYNGNNIANAAAISEVGAEVLESAPDGGDRCIDNIDGAGVVAAIEKSNTFNCVSAGTEVEY